MTIYEENGFKNRHHYISSLAEARGLDEEIALSMANFFGPNEDFDGLVNTLDDIADPLQNRA
jgi:hypothetical protein